MKRWVKRSLGVLLSLIAIVAGLGYYMHYYGQSHPRIIKPLQNPFRFNNGSEIVTKEDWDVRRTEIKQLLLEIEYGRMPTHPDLIQLQLDSNTAIEESGTQIGTEMLVKVILTPFLTTPELRITFTLWLYIPLGEGPFPMIINVGPDAAGSEVSIYLTMVKRGYLFACYDHEELDPDTDGYDEAGPCQSAYPDYDWGSLAVWAWGAMRVADILLNETWVQPIPELPKIDPDVLIVTGHSRRGKTALIAGAYDERFTMVVPNGSGCGGAGSYLIQGSGCETLKSITSEKLYKSWFQKDFGKYGGHEEDLPFDQHFLRALVAPRLMLSTDGRDDLWANPPGTQAMYQAAQKVFDFLEVGKNNAIHFRKGGHGYLEEDFAVVLDFADYMFFGKAVTNDFYVVPYDFEIPYEE